MFSPITSGPWRCTTSSADNHALRFRVVSTLQQVSRPFSKHTTSPVGGAVDLIGAGADVAAFGRHCSPDTEINGTPSARPQVTFSCDAYIQVEHFDKLPPWTWGSR